MADMEHTERIYNMEETLQTTEERAATKMAKERAATEIAETPEVAAATAVTETTATTKTTAAPCPKCSGKTKERSDKEYRDLMNRLRRIEGQVRGIQGMLERDAYCTDILMQVAAVSAALNSFNRVLLSNHLHTCVAENIRAGNDEILDELVVLLQRLMK